MSTCVNEDHYPTDRPLNILTLDPRLHFPDEHGDDCVDGYACDWCSAIDSADCIGCAGSGRVTADQHAMVILLMSDIDA